MMQTKLHLDVDWLRGKYWDEKLSMYDMAILADVSPQTIQYWMVKLGIPRRSLSKAHEGRLYGEKHPMWGKRREKSFNWKGGRIRTSQGYILVLKRGHPRASKQNYVSEHRLVMEKYLGRYLEPWEIIHHINGIKDDNRLKNLQLLPKGKHTLTTMEINSQVQRAETRGKRYERAFYRVVAAWLDIRQTIRFRTTENHASSRS